MKITENTKYILGTIGLILIGLAYAAYSYNEELMALFAPHAPKEVHVHAGFLFTILGEKVDLTADKYQSSAQSVKHKHMHFHDNIDNMLHRHAPGITLGEFLSSIGITLTNMCVTLDTGAEYCAYENNAVQLYVNGTVVQNPASYVIQQEDQLLLYYGSPSDVHIPELIQSVSDEACIYSGTCPERGDPPAESCGITCEI